MRENATTTLGPAGTIRFFLNESTLGRIKEPTVDLTLHNVNASGNGGNGVDIRSSLNVTVSGTFAMIHYRTLD